MKIFFLPKIALLFLFSLLLSASTLQHSSKRQTTHNPIYDGIEFEMPKVIEPTIPNRSVSISDFGAQSGGTALNTQAFDDAINALSKKGGGRVVIPRGLWLTGPIKLKSNIELHAEQGALVIFSKDKTHYPLIETSFEGLNTVRCISPIYGRDLENIAITGKGIFDGSGEVWRPVKKDKLTESQWKTLIRSGGVLNTKGNIWYPSQQYLDAEKSADMNIPVKRERLTDYESVKDFLRPVMVSLIKCNKVLIDGPVFQNSPAWCLHPLMCENLTMRNTTVRNPWFSQNGDGIDIESCKNALVYDCSFDVGDDAICIKSGKDKDGRDRKMPSENLIIKNCVVYHGHGEVTVGSEMSSGVKNMHVSNCTFMGTDVGLRFKSTRGRGGIVEGVYISDIDMINIPTQAISFNLYYGGKSASEELESGAESPKPEKLAVNEETPQFKNIYLTNISCKGAMHGVFLQGLPEMKLENVNLTDIDMECDWGFTCIDADGVRVKSMKLTTAKLPAISIQNSRNVSMDRLILPDSNNPIIRVSGAESSEIVFGQNNLTNPASQIAVDEKLIKSEAVKYSIKK